MTKNAKILIGVAITLIILSAAGLGYLWMTQAKPMLMPNVIGLKQEEARALLKGQAIVFEEEYSDEFEEGYIFKSNPKVGKEVKGTIVLKVSKGKNVEIKVPEDILKMKKEEIEQWGKENKLTIKFIEIVDDAEAGTFVRTSMIKNLKQGDTFVIYVSKAKEEKKEEPKEEPKKPTVQQPVKPQNVSKTVNIPDNLWGKSESEFISFIKGKGLMPNKLNYRMYSTTIKPGHVYEHDSGEFNPGAEVYYILSRGAYVFDTGDFNGKTKDQAASRAKELDKLNAHVSINFIEETNDNSVGKTFGCSEVKDGIHHNVTCKIGKKTVHEHSWTETERVEAKPGEDGYVIHSCTCGETKKDILPALPVIKKAYMPASMIFESMVFSTADEAINFLKGNTLASFTNVSYRKETTKDYSVGCVYRVEVNGNASYEPGEIDVTTPITVYVSNGY